MKHSLARRGRCGCECQRTQVILLARLMLNLMSRIHQSSGMQLAVSSCNLGGRYHVPPGQAAEPSWPAISRTAGSQEVAVLRPALAVAR